MTEVFTAFGEKGVAAEAVAANVLKASRHYQASQAAVDQYLADQLLLPMALAGGGHLPRRRGVYMRQPMPASLSNTCPLRLSIKKCPMDR